MSQQLIRSTSFRYTLCPKLEHSAYVTHALCPICRKIENLFLFFSFCFLVFPFQFFLLVCFEVLELTFKPRRPAWDVPGVAGEQPWWSRYAEILLADLRN